MKPRRWRGAVPVALAVGLSLLGTLAARPPDSLSWSDLDRWIAPPGHHEVVPGGQGGVTVLETGRGAGGALAVDASPTAREVIAGFGAVAASWVIESAHAGSTTHSKASVVSDDGLRTVSEEAPDARAIRYQPGALGWPARARVGEQWQSVGTAYVEDTSVPYTRTGHLESGGAPHCLKAVVEETLGAERRSWTETRCAGRGVVARDDQRAAPDAPRVSGISLPSTSPQQVAWPAAWQGEKRAPHSGTLPIVLQLPVAPVPVEGALVAVNSHSRSLMMLAPIQGEWRVLWRRYPGASPTALTAVGQLLLVATSDRKLVAYDAAGRWLWSAPMGDVANVAPVAAWPGVVVTATLDGQLSAYADATGELLWRRIAPGGTGVAPLAAGPVVVAVGGADVVATDRAGHRAWTFEAPSAVKSMAHAPATDQTILSTDEGHLMAVDKSGSMRWGTRRSQHCRELHVLGDAAVCVDDARVSAYAASDGRVLWELDVPSRGSATDGRDLLVAGVRELVRVRATGQVHGRWPERPRVGYSLWLVPVADGVVVTDGAADFTHWRAL